MRFFDQGGLWRKEKLHENVTIGQAYYSSASSASA